MQAITRTTLWLGFFGIILASWVWMYMMSTGMGLDLLGRPGAMSMDTPMGSEMSMDDEMPMSGEMEVSEDMPMSREMTSDQGMSDGMMSDDAMTEDGAMAPMDGQADMGDGMNGSMDMSTDGMAMDTMQMDGMAMDMSAMTRFGPLFAMWAGMMAAMMLPTMIPTLRSYEDLMKSADGTRAGWLGVLLGYFIAWVAFAAAITAVQLWLLSQGFIDMMGIPTSRWSAAGLLIVVGAFQFTRVKEICHGVCHSPMTYFLGYWKTGLGGGLRMGLGLGAFCVVCCWGFMALGFVGGVMNLAWMGLATLFMVIEKLPQIGHYVTKPAGVILILAGIGVAVWPYLGG